MVPVNTSPGTTLGGARELLLLFSHLGLWHLCRKTRGKGRLGWAVSSLPGWSRTHGFVHTAMFLMVSKSPQCMLENHCLMF